MDRVKLNRFTDPEMCFHVTQENDNIMGIARRYGVAPRDVVNLNKRLSHMTQRSRSGLRACCSLVLVCRWY